MPFVIGKVLPKHYKMTKATHTISFGVGGTLAAVWCLVPPTRSGAYQVITGISICIFNL